jgi:hypothetical protein
MGARTEQYTTYGGKPGGGTKSSWRNWKRNLKRSVNRLWRREGKKHLEDASKRRPTGGWSD